MKKYILLSSIFISLLASIVLFMSTDSGIRADFPKYESENSLVNEADVIVYATILNEGIESKININSDKDDEPIYFDYTVFDVKVLDAIKGNLKNGDTIKIKQMGNGDNLDVKEYGYFNKGREYVLFLEKYDNGTPYSTLSPFQGHLNIEGNFVIPNKGNYIHNEELSENKLSETSLQNIKMDKNSFITRLKRKFK